MKSFVVTSLFALGLYLALTVGTGDVGIAGLGLWSMEELFLGIAVALVTGFASHRFFCRTGNMRMANPLRWLLFVAYFFGPFMFALAKANISVAYRILTGRIRPGIVRIETGLKSDLEVMLLANSITLTPGTLTVDVDPVTKDLFVHWLNVEKGAERAEKCDTEKICGSFVKWTRRIAG